MLLLAVPALAQAQNAKTFRPDATPGDLACTTGSATRDLHTNEVIARLYNTGGLFWKGSGNVYEVPAYGGAHAVFAEGIWLGGMVGGELRFAGSDYGPFEFFPGPLDAGGNPPADCTPYDRIFVVSEKDLQAFDAGLPHTSDIEEWPWQLGAPVVDGDGNPDNYNLAGGDRPEVPGHQTAWWVMNDAAGMHGMSQTKPIRMEIQVTAFAVATPDALNYTTFYRYRLVYKGSEPFMDAWFGVWMDDDLGDASDDFVGSDPSLDMAYFYNGDNEDAGADGYGSPPPAFGHVIVQGPFGEEDGKDNDGDGKIDESGERLGMTKTLYYNGDSSVQGNPGNGSEMYGYLRGIWRDGRPMTFGGSGYGGTTPTDFMFPGDPVTKSFWTELNTDGQGHGNQPADRRFLMSTGPFSMNPGEVQDIVIALVWSRGTDHLNSITTLREDAAFVREAFQNGTIESYPVPQNRPAPDITLSDAAVSAIIQEGEVAAETIAITNTGDADLQWRIEGMPRPGISRFVVTANAAGPLDLPDMGALAFNSSGFPTPNGQFPYCDADPQVVDYTMCNDRPSEAQQVGPARWGMHAGGSDVDFDARANSYLRRTLNGRDITSLGIADYEWRFTGTSLALRGFQDGGVTEVPFALWNAGPGTPDDPSDDYRMIPLIVDNNTSGVFDLGGDHQISGRADDPFTDWVYWYDPVDTSPGEAGYRAYENEGDIDSTQIGNEVLAAQILVGWNLGTAPPYLQELPEPGTIFRIETIKEPVLLISNGSGNLKPGESAEVQLVLGRFSGGPGVYRDTLTVHSRVPDKPEVSIPITLEVTPGTTSSETIGIPDRFELHPNYPNPFNPSTTITYGIPAVGPARIVLYDVLGRRIRVLFDSLVEPGWHTITFHADDLPSGLYFYRLEAGSFRAARPMLLAK